MIKLKNLNFWGKTICVVIVVLTIAIYCNIGYWGGKSFEKGLLTQFSPDKHLSPFQKFQLGTWNDRVLKNHFLASEDTKEYEKQEGGFAFSSVLFWPIGLAGSLGTWFVKFVFLGDLFKIVF